MNEVFLTLGIESWKPAVTALLMPPLPFVVLILAGARLMFRRRLLAWLLVLLGTAGVWLSATTAVGQGLVRWLLRPPPALEAAQIGALRRAPHTAIVVLGAGRQLLAPEYGISTLTPASVERLRYGLWLARETALPAAYSGGVGHGAAAGATEAEIAARIAEREFGRPLRWTEAEARDTRENALKTVAMLEPLGIEQLVVVTHGYHMRRAMQDFERAAAGHNLKLVAAPLGSPGPGHLRLDDWLPRPRGYEATWQALHEWLGILAGA